MLESTNNVLYWLPSVFLGLLTLLVIFVALGLHYGFFRKSLSSWSWRYILSFNVMSFREEQFLASMQAEELVEDALRAAGWKHVFLRRRIHLSRLGHNREIDVVAVGPVVLVIEVKHWRGYVWSNGPRWFQRAHDSKRALEFEDIQEDNLVKAAALRRYIENDKRIPLSDFHLVHSGLTGDVNDESNTSKEYGTWYTDRRVHKQCGKLIIPIVVFTNSAVKLDPNTVKMKKYVFDLPSFQKYAQQLMHEMRGGCLYQCCLSPMRGLPSLPLPWGRPSTPSSPSPPLSLTPQEETRVAAALASVRTWDMIYLHSGRLLHGDVTALDLPSHQARVERRGVLGVEVVWFEGLPGLLRSLWTGAGGVARVKVKVKSEGNRKKQHQHRELTVLLGRRNMKRMGVNDRVIIKLAGTRNSETVALADIYKMRISQHMEETS